MELDIEEKNTVMTCLTCNKDNTTVTDPECGEIVSAIAAWLSLKK